MDKHAGDTVCVLVCGANEDDAKAPHAWNPLQANNTLLKGLGRPLSGPATRLFWGGERLVESRLTTWGTYGQWGAGASRLGPGARLAFAKEGFRLQGIEEA